MQDCKVLEVVSGSLWTAVVVESGSEKRCGLATTVSRRLVNRSETQVYPELVGRSSKKVAQLTYQIGTRAASIGLAAINASINPSRLQHHDGHGVDTIAEMGAGKRVVLVGHFPFVDDLRASVGHLDVLELLPKPGDLPVTEAPNILPHADVVAITSMTLINGTLNSIMPLTKPGIPVVMIGPSTPLTPLMYEVGIYGLCGSVVEDIPFVLEGIREGLSFRDLRHRGIRLVYSHR